MVDSLNSAAKKASNEAAGNIEFENGEEQLPIELVDDQEEEEMFNPQEINFDEVTRLRDRVASLENVMAQNAAKSPELLFKSFIESQEASHRAQAKVNQGLLEVIANL